MVKTWKVERFTHQWALTSVFFLHPKVETWSRTYSGFVLTVTNGPSESGYSFTLKHTNLKLNSLWAGELYDVRVTPIPQSERYLYPWRHTFLFCACSDTWKGRRAFLCLQTHFSLVSIPVWSAVKCEFMFDHFLKHRMRCSSICNAGISHNYSLRPQEDKLTLFHLLTVFLIQVSAMSRWSTCFFNMLSCSASLPFFWDRHEAHDFLNNKSLNHRKNKTWT